MQFSTLASKPAAVKTTNVSSEGEQGMENQSIFRFKASVLCESPIMSFIQMVSTFFIACTFFLCVSARDNELLIPYLVSLI